MKIRMLSLSALALMLFAIAEAADTQEQKAKVDSIVAGGTVVTMDAGRRILEDGAVRTLKESVVIEIVRGARLRADIGNIYG